MSAAVPKLDYTARDFDTNLAALMEFIKIRYPEKWNSFFEGDLGTALAELIAYDFSVLSYIMDMQTQECFLDTLQLRESLLHFARLTGYEVRRASPASIETYAEVTQPPAPGSSYLIRKGTPVRSKDGQVWEVNTDTSIESGKFYPSRTVSAYPDIHGRIVTPGGTVKPDVVVRLKIEPSGSTAVLCDEEGNRMPSSVVFPQGVDAGCILKLVQYENATVPDILHDEFAIIEVGKFAHDVYDRSVLFLDRVWDLPGTFIGQWRIENRNVPLTQGESQEEAFTAPTNADERKNYTIKAAFFPVIGTPANEVVPSGFFGSTKAGSSAGAGVTVLVNGNLWVQTSSLLFETGEARVYETDLDEFDRLAIRFGDGVFGSLIPEGAQVVVQYRTGGGALGNLPQNAFDTTVIAKNLNDPNEPVTVYLTNPYTVGRGGQDRESLHEAKKNIPLFVRTNDRAVTVEDYAFLASNFMDATAGRITLAKGVLHTNVVPREQNIVWVYSWVKGDNGQLVAPTLALKSRLLEYLNDRKMITDEVVIVDGVSTIVPVVLRYQMQKSADSYVTAGKVQVAVNEVFAKLTPGSTLFLSDLYESVTAIPELDFVNILEPKENVVPQSSFELFSNTVQIARPTKLVSPVSRGDTTFVVAATTGFAAKGRVLVYEAGKVTTTAIVDHVSGGTVTLRSDYPLQDSYSTDADVLASDYQAYGWAYERRVDVFVRYTAGLGVGQETSDAVNRKIRDYFEKTLRPEEPLSRTRLELLVRSVPNVTGVTVNLNSLDGAIEQVISSSREKLVLGVLTINNTVVT